MLQEDFDRIFYKCLGFWRKMPKVWGTDLLDDYKDFTTPAKPKSILNQNYVKELFVP